jgi:hypothetical protein
VKDNVDFYLIEKFRALNDERAGNSKPAKTACSPGWSDYYRRKHEQYRQQSGQTP